MYNNTPVELKYRFVFPVNGGPWKTLAVTGSNQYATVTNPQIGLVLEVTAGAELVSTTYDKSNSTLCSIPTGALCLINTTFGNRVTVYVNLTPGKQVLTKWCVVNNTATPFDVCLNSGSKFGDQFETRTEEEKLAAACGIERKLVTIQPGASTCYEDLDYTSTHLRLFNSLYGGMGFVLPGPGPGIIMAPDSPNPAYTASNSIQGGVGTTTLTQRLVADSCILGTIDYDSHWWASPDSTWQVVNYSQSVINITETVDGDHEEDPVSLGVGQTTQLSGVRDRSPVTSFLTITVDNGPTVTVPFMSGMDGPRDQFHTITVCKRDPEDSTRAILTTAFLSANAEPSNDFYTNNQTTGLPPPDPEFQKHQTLT